MTRQQSAGSGDNLDQEMCLMTYDPLTTFHNFDTGTVFEFFPPTFLPLRGN